MMSSPVEPTRHNAAPRPVPIDSARVLFEHTVSGCVQDRKNPGDQIMSKIALTAITAGALSVLAISSAFAKGDAKAGEIKANTCIGCHGIPSYQVPYPTRHVPKIGG